jgi:hypothetical protein
MGTSSVATLEEAMTFVMAPNPAQNFVTLSADIDNAVIRIFALNGQLVDEHLSSNLMQGHRMPLNLNEGIYFVEVSNGTHRSIQRLVIQH